MKRLKAYGNHAEGRFILLDDSDYEKYSAWHWSVDRLGYAKRNIWNRQKKKWVMTLLHHLIIGKPAKGMMADHINGNKLDNRSSNLRIVTPEINTLNRRMHKNNSSGFRGVCWHKKSKLWRACLKFRGKQYSSDFKSKEEAIKYREKLVKEIFLPIKV